MSTEQKQDPFKRLPNEITLLILSKINEVKTVGLVSMVSNKFAALTIQIKNINLKMATSSIPRPLPLHSEDHFNGLPNELILIILSKIEDVKTLCLVSMVSTKFASLVLQIKNVTINMTMKSPLPRPPSNSPKTITFFQKFFPTTKNSGSETLDFPRTFDFRPVSIFLAKFIFLEKVVFIIPTTNTNTNSSKDEEVIKWTGHYNLSKETARFVLVCGNRSWEGKSDDEFFELGQCFVLKILMAYECVWEIVKKSPNNMKHLKSAVVTDAGNENVVDILEESIACERSQSSSTIWVGGEVPLPNIMYDYHIWDLYMCHKDFVEVKAVLFATTVEEIMFVPLEHEESKMIDDFEDGRGCGPPYWGYV